MSDCPDAPRQCALGRSLPIAVNIKLRAYEPHQISIHRASCTESTETRNACAASHTRRRAANKGWTAARYCASIVCWSVPYAHQSLFSADMPSKQGFVLTCSRISDANRHNQLGSRAPVDANSLAASLLEFARLATQGSQKDPLETQCFLVTEGLRKVDWEKKRAESLQKENRDNFLTDVLVGIQLPDKYHSIFKGLNKASKEHPTVFLGEIPTEMVRMSKHHFLTLPTTDEDFSVQYTNVAFIETCDLFELSHWSNMLDRIEVRASTHAAACGAASKWHAGCARCTKVIARSYSACLAEMCNRVHSEPVRGHI